MSGRADTEKRRVLLLAAHPNDEFGLAATLRAHVMSGDEVWAAWFANDDRGDVQDRRRAEAVSALELIGVPPERLVFADLPAVALASQLTKLVAAVRDVGEHLAPDLAYVPAFEGGHPDHDALNFAAWEGLAATGVEVREFPVYRRAKGRRFLHRIPRFARLLPGVAEPQLRWLEPEEVEFKHRLWRVYRTQRPLFDMLLRVSGDEYRFFTTEQNRPLPLRDYTKPPHERPLLYEGSATFYTFAEFATSVRRFHLSGGAGDEEI